MLFFTKLLSNKIFWYVVIGLIILVIILKYKNIVIDKFKGRIEGDYGNTITDGRKVYLQSLANELNVDINSSFSNATDSLVLINALNDDEFRFLAKYYNRQFSNSMFSDIDNELLYRTDADEKVLARLRQQNLI